MPRRSTALLATLGLAAVALAAPLVLRKRTRDADDAAPRDADDDDFYERQARPPWAPPAWAFPVAWTLNTVALAAAAQHLAFRQNHARRTELLAYLAAHFALYATFSRVYFDERSPVLAAAWTSADFAVCHLAFYRALPVSRPVALAFAPVNLWLTLALPLSLYQAAANRDPLFGAAGIEAGEIVAGALGVSPIPAARPA